MSHVADFQISDIKIREVTSKIIKNLELNVDEVRYQFIQTANNYTSLQHYICVKFKNETKGQNEELFIIIKRPAQDGTTEIHNVDAQFHNEIVFYRMYAQPDENFARCFYTNEQPPVDTVIVLENVTKVGYHPCLYKYNAPLEYTLAAMREMGRFHGKGYVMKELQRKKFFDIVGQLQEDRYDKKAKNEYFKNFVNGSATRAVNYLRSRDYDAVFCDKMEAFLLNGYDQVMMRIVQPLEPLSTLCHGDFTLDNVLFKTENDGQHRAMLIDFAFMRYSTPVVDLSTYFCICCFNEENKNKFSDIMRAYHDALKEYLLDAGIWDIEKYSYDALLDDYRRGSLFGFLIASFYLSALLGYFKGDAIKTRNMSWIDTIKLNQQAGGDEVSKILADMLLHLRDLGCLKHIL